MLLFFLMKQIPGSFGTILGFSLRLGQTVSSGAALMIMSRGVDFYDYTAFCYVIMVMSLMIPWSSVAAVIDAFFAFTHHAIIYPSYLMFVVGVDWLLSVLSLSAACSMAGVTQALVVDHGCTPKYCARYQISCSLTFAAWVFIAISSLVNFWVLGSSMN